MNEFSRPIISAVVAISQNRVIGKNNQLPWHMPADLKHFKALTTGNIIIMGRKTYQSIGKPLPNRTNVVVTKDHEFKAAGTKIVHSIERAIQFGMASKSPEFFIIGGAQLFKQSWPYLNRLYLTVIHHEFKGDSYFPEIDKEEWHEIECISHFADEDNPYAYSFITMDRVSLLSSLDHT